MRVIFKFKVPSVLLLSILSSVSVSKVFSLSSRPNIMRCPSYPNINNIYNYTYSFQNIDAVMCNNYKYIINDKKKRNIYLRLRENMVNRNIYL